MTAPTALSPWPPTPRRMTRQQGDAMLAHLQALGWRSWWRADGSLQLTHTCGRTITRHATTTLDTIRDAYEGVREEALNWEDC